MFTLVAVIFAAGAIILALLASGSAQPLLLPVLASLAMLGVFFLLATAAGHIRIGDRASEGGILKALSDGLEDGLQVTTRDGAILYANARLAELLGSPHGNRLDALEAAFAGRPQASEVLFRLKRAAARGEPRVEDVAIEPAFGRGGTRWLRIAVKPLPRSDNDYDLAQLNLWQVSDVSGEVAREAGALEVASATRALFDELPVGLIAASADGTITTVNATFARWMGLSPEAPSDRMRLSDVLSADGAALIANMARREGGGVARIDLDLVADGGQIVPARLLCRALGGPEGERKLLIAVLNRDDDEAEEGAGDAAEVRFAKFFQSAPFGIATVGADGRIASSNAAFARMILDGSSSITLPAVEALCRSSEPDVQATVAAGLKEVLSGRSSVAPIEITVGAKREFTRRVFMSPLARGKKGREAAILYVIDATEQKALEAKFAQSQKMEAVGQLAGGIAHDFNNVLTAIIGFSDLLLTTHRPGDPPYKDIMNIKTSANRAAGLVRQLVAFSRRQTLQAEVLLMSEVLIDLAPLLNRSIGEKIELKMPTTRDLWYVKADKTQLEQVVINLAVNARDAMPSGGTLTIRTRNLTERQSQKLGSVGMPVGEYVLIEAEDTGTGMPPEVLAKIFEPFYTTKGVGKGTGLGLATVYGIVKQTGGYIFADSVVGKGTTFRIYLPRHHVENEAAFAAQKAAASKKERPSGDLTGTGRVLLVEDEDQVRNFAVRGLKRQGYEVVEASTGIEALEQMVKHAGQIDIVVSDVVMPEMDGPTLLKELRKSNPNLKIVFISGYPHEAFETTLDKDDKFAFLAKPFTLPQLAAKVKEQLASK